MFVFSLQSTMSGGFIHGKPCEVLDDNGRMSIISVRRLDGGGYITDNTYEVYNEQLYEELPRPIAEIKSMHEEYHDNVVDIFTKEPLLKSKNFRPLDMYARIADRMYTTGEKVWVFSRQSWGGFFEYKMPAQVCQNQIGYSVMTDVPGSSGEFYDYQLKPRKDWVQGGMFR